MGMFDMFKSNKVKRQEKELKELARDLFGESGLYRDTTYEAANMEDFNPDDLDLETYEKMLQDGQVNAAVMMIKLVLLSRGYEITGEHSDFIIENLERLDGHFDEILKEMLTAIEFGYSCTEKVFEYVDGQIMLKKLKVLDPKTVRVKTDRFGDIQYIKQYVGQKQIKIKPEKVIWWSYDKRFGNPYGQSELRRVYKHYFIRDKMYRFANIAYERYGTPLLVGRVEDAKHVGRMKSLLRTINGLSGLSISGNDTIEAISGTRADFVAYIDHHAQQIMVSLLVPPMLLNLGTNQGGSYSLSENQLDVFIYRIQALQRQVAAMVEEQLIRPLIDYNFSDAEEYPAFVFKPMVDKDLESLATVFTQLINAQVIAPDEEWLRERLGFPLMDKSKLPEDDEDGPDKPPAGDEVNDLKPGEEKSTEEIKNELEDVKNAKKN